MRDKDFNQELIKKIAAKFKAIRINLGIEIETVINDTNMNVEKVEAGQSEIDFLTITVLCKYYNVTLDYFFKGI